MWRLSERCVRTHGAVTAPGVVPVLLVVLRDTASHSTYCGRCLAPCLTAALAPRLLSPSPPAAGARTSARCCRRLGHAPVGARLVATPPAGTPPRGERRDATINTKRHLVAAGEREHARAGAPTQYAAGFNQLTCAKQPRRSRQHNRPDSGAQARHSNRRLAHGAHSAIGGLDEDVGRAQLVGSSAWRANIAACTSVDNPALRSSGLIARTGPLSTAGRAHPLHLARPQGDCRGGATTPPRPAGCGLRV